ncbi:uncharacterized protein LOC125667798 [Ostrea edulis]|uniref:uncharacterized protein LOC125667798 n=1 Tax=Ostrea edulis TaxID=37623 RepID=UPI0024AEE3AD|nr:uncharacterized protein LOC125667798 [Ostrea edulis]XP_056007169.1 uncharacterized protein LOC125667798 [Ostrea edulis]XP_056007170.1 uncharacterized protein LOC125667798 [Ostrea edulis]
MLVYSFYPFIIELSFYVRDTENRLEMYYMSDSPYSPARFCRCLIFTGNNKYYAAIRIILLITIVTSFVYLLKSQVYEQCNCSMKSSNIEQDFQHAENYYTTLTNIVLLVWGVVNFFLLNVALLLNSDGVFDAFLIFDITGLCNGDFFLRLIPVAVFLKDHKKQRTSLKIQKLSLILTYKFWSKIFFINSITSSCKCRLVRYIITFSINVILILCSTFCPLVCILHAFYVRFISLVGMCIFSSHMSKISETKPCITWILQFIGNIFIHGGALAYIITSYIYAFNIFFYGISYLIQFCIYTTLLAVPHFSVEKFIYVIYLTSLVLYICRYIYQFTKLYKNLLKEVLDLTEDKCIPVKCFKEIVDKYFPLRREVFFLFIKIISSVLFFLIIFDTMQRVGYVNTGAQPDLTTFITLLFLFGPPRIVEILLVTEFTSRVHMKHLEIKEIVEGMRNAMNDNSNTTVDILSEPEISQCTFCNCIYKKCKTNFEHPKINAPKQSDNELDNNGGTESVTCERCGQNICCFEDGQNCCRCCCSCCSCCSSCCCCYCVLRFIYTLCCACICPGHLNKCVCLISKVKTKKEVNSIDVETYPFEIECCCILLPENQEDTNPITQEDTNPITQDTNPKTREDTNPKTSEDTNRKTLEDTNLITQDTNPINQEDTNLITQEDTNSITQDTNYIALEDIALLKTEEDTDVEDTLL